MLVHTASCRLQKPVHTVAEKCDYTVAEKWDCRRCLAVFCDSLTFLWQCGQGLRDRTVKFNLYWYTFMSKKLVLLNLYSPM